MATASRLETITGYFLPSNQQCQEVDDDDYDLSDDEDWKDFDDLSGGGSGHSGKPLKKEKLLFNVFSGRQFTLVGQFPLTQPWLQARVKVRKNKHTTKYTIGYPSYSVRSDNKVASDGVISLFLEACGVDYKAREMFLEFVRSVGAATTLSFDNLPEYLGMFGAQNMETNHDVMTYMTMLIEESGAGNTVWNMKKFPLVSQYIPQLLPRCYKEICLDDQLVEKLEEVLDEKPWVFAFYKVAKFLTGVGKEATLLRYKVCDDIMEGITQPYKDAMYIYDVLKTTSHKYGHTYVTKPHLQNSRLFGDYKLHDFEAGLEFLKKEKILKVDEDAQNGVEVTRVFLSYLHAAELGIAEDVLDMFQHAQSDPWLLTLNTASPAFSRIKADPEQYAAAKLIATRPMVCISGKGGCGKTTVVSTVIAQQELHQSGTSEPVVLLTAPTGKAANLLGKRSKLPGFTLHSVVLSYRNWKARWHEYNKKKTPETKDPQQDNADTKTQDIGNGATKTETENHSDLRGDSQDSQPESQGNQQQDPEEPVWKFHKVRLLVVDECSLVGVKLFNALLHCLLNDSQLQKVILLGDVNQLPSIEPGYFLGDMYTALDKLGCSIVLTTNHRSEADLIVSNASAIAERRVPIIDPEQNFHQITIQSGQQGDLSCEQDAAVHRLLKAQVPGIDIKDHHTSQFVAFRRRDCEAINEKCSMHYSGHSLKTHDDKRDFRVGDKVCCTKNGDVSVKEMYTQYDSYLDNIPSNSKPTITPEDRADVDRQQTQNPGSQACEPTGTTVRLSNGEIFFIVDDLSQQSSSASKPERYLVLHDPDRSDDVDHYMKISYKELRRNCKLRHAWARTIHTYQGSESSTVVYVVGSANFQTWQHVYTAVTRGKKKVILVTEAQHLHTAITTRPWTRNTTLKQRLLKNLDPSAYQFPECSEASQDSMFSDFDDDTMNALLEDENLQSPSRERADNRHSNGDNLDAMLKDDSDIELSESEWEELGLSSSNTQIGARALTLTQGQASKNAKPFIPNQQQSLLHRDSRVQNQITELKESDCGDDFDEWDLQMSQAVVDIMDKTAVENTTYSTNSATNSNATENVRGNTMPMLLSPSRASRPKPYDGVSPMRRKLEQVKLLKGEDGDWESKRKTRRKLSH